MGDLDDQVIAGRVAEAVVELFEAVRSTHQREAHPDAPVAVDLMRSRQRRTPVGDPRQLVAERRWQQRVALGGSVPVAPDEQHRDARRDHEQHERGLGSGRSRLEMSAGVAAPATTSAAPMEHHERRQ